MATSNPAGDIWHGWGTTTVYTGIGGNVPLLGQWTTNTTSISPTVDPMLIQNMNHTIQMLQTQIQAFESRLRWLEQSITLEQKHEELRELGNKYRDLRKQLVTWHRLADDINEI